MTGVRSLIGMFVVCMTLSAFANESTDRQVSYYKEIRPIFQANCQGCHQPAKAKGDYIMTSFDKMMQGSDPDEPVVVAGKPGESILVELITPVDGEAEMPPKKGPLAETEIELVTKWIEQGAKDDTPANALVRFSKDNPPVYTLPPVVTSIDYSPDGKLIAVAGFHEVLLHHADGSGKADRLIGLSERIESVSFSPDGKKLAVTGGRPARMGEVQVWDVEKRKLDLSRPVTFDTVYGASWSPDGKLIAFGCGDNTVRAIDAKTGEQVLYQAAHNDWVFDTVFSTDGTHVISVSRDRTTKLSEVATQRFIDNITSITPKALKGGTLTVDHHPKLGEVLVGGADGTPQIYRTTRIAVRRIGDNSNLIKQFPPMVGRVFAAEYSPDGNRIAAIATLDGRSTLQTYNSDFDRTVSNELKAAYGQVAGQRKPAQKELVRKYQNDGVKVLSKTEFDTSVYTIAYSPDGKTIAAACSDGKMRLINTEDGKIASEFNLVALADNQQLAATDDLVADDDGQSDSTGQSGQLPDGAKVVSLSVQPAEVVIAGVTEYVQLIVTGKMASGDSVDLTRLVEFKTKDSIAALTPRGIVRPLEDGSGVITAAFQGSTVDIPVRITAFANKAAMNFIRDVNPVLSRVGCNAGTCHGSKDGKAGFKLSLRGYDPIYDVRAFTDDIISRRSNVASPDDSLMLLKATAGVPHEGGQLFKPHSKYYRIIRDWIAIGSKLDLDTPRVASITLFPTNPVVQRVGATQQMRVVATYSDGSSRDVTEEAFVESGSIDILDAGERGLMTTLRRGEAPILARYEGAYAATTLTVMGDRTGFAWKQPPTNNQIDELVAAKLKRMKILPSGLCTDEAFLRRVHLDLTGLPPTADDVRTFLSDDREQRVKREAVIDKLVDSDEHVEYMANKWADLLQVNRKFLGAQGASQFRKWIRDEIANNTPYDQFVYKILTASGSNRTNPAASYFKILREPANMMENTTHLFLATRFNCNKCHDHPFERWTQDQYYETAAYFARVSLKRDPASKGNIGGTAVEKAKPLYEVIEDQADGEVKHDRTGAVSAPAFPYDARFDVPKDASRRTRLAKWITSADNRYFASSYVNRLWGYLMGVGLIEPLDDIRAGNPATNPELLGWLTKEFVASKFDVRHLIRTICKSRTYQLAISTNRWNEDDEINYSHAIARRLPAEALFDAIHRVTGSVPRIPGVAAGTRAAMLPDAGVRLADGFLANFGRPVRESACECERSNDVQLGPIMALVAGPTANKAISDPNNAIAKLVASEKDDRKLIDEIFLRVLNRNPTQAEVDATLEAVKLIDGEHKGLIAELKQYEVALKPTTDKLEKARADRIAKATKVLKAYEAKIAPREAELNKKQEDDVAKRQADFKKYDDALVGKLADWEAKYTATPSWVVLDPKSMKSSDGAKLEKLEDGSIFASGKLARTDYTIIADTDLKGITGIRLEALPDKRLPKNGPGRAPNDGNFVVTEFVVKAGPAKQPKKAANVKLQSAQADFSQKDYDVKTAIDGKKDNQRNGWAIAPQMGKAHTAIFETAGDVGGDTTTTLTFTLSQYFSSNKHTLGRFRLAITNAPRPLRLSIPDDIQAILAVESGKRSKEQVDKLVKYYKESDPTWIGKRDALANAKKPRPIDPKLKTLKDKLAEVSEPLPVDPKLAQLRRAVELSTSQLDRKRLVTAQDLTWALINSSAFLFNH